MQAGAKWGDARKPKEKQDYFKVGSDMKKPLDVISITLMLYC